MKPAEQEQKMLDILNQDELESPAGDSEVEAAFPELTEEAKKIMAKVMKAKLPSPEEIELAEKIARHNRVVDLRRKLDLRRRELRRGKRGAFSRKDRKRRRKLGK